MYFYLIKHPYLKDTYKFGITNDIDKRLTHYNANDPLNSFKYNFIAVGFEKDVVRMEEYFMQIATHKKEWYIGGARTLKTAFRNSRIRDVLRVIVDYGYDF